VDVIPFPYRAWFYVEKGVNVFAAWLDEIQVPEADRSQLRALLVLYENGGHRAIASATDDIGDGLLALVSIRKGGLALAPIFCRGPFSDTEITILCGGIWNDKVLRPYSAKGAALENLEMLRAEPGRRRRERITEAT
jgi:hypothetical protein